VVGWFIGPAVLLALSIVGMILTRGRPRYIRLFEFSRVMVIMIPLMMIVVVLTLIFG
jgi:hypothetical protein